MMGNLNHGKKPEKSPRIQFLEEEMMRMHLLSGRLEGDPSKKERVEYYHRKIWDHQEEYKIRTGDYYHAVYKKRND